MARIVVFEDYVKALGEEERSQHTTHQKTHAFTLILSGIRELTPEMADAIFAAGCHDATPSSCNGIVSVDFDREAESLGDAVGSAVVRVLGTVPGARQKPGPDRYRVWAGRGRRLSGRGDSRLFGWQFGMISR